MSFIVLLGSGASAAPHEFSRPSRLFVVMFGALCGLILISGCGGTNAGSQGDGVIRWNTELSAGEALTDKCDPSRKITSLSSADEPKLIPATETSEARYRIVAIPCPGSKEGLTYEVPLSRVVRVTYVSDPLQPPRDLSDPEAVASCCRQRTGWWVFDKVELRAFGAFRGLKDSVTYLSAGGSQTYHSSFFGTDRGGSAMVFGGEASLLWNLPTLPTNLQLGVLTGAYAADESVFVPLGAHLRYTFNQSPPRFGGSCNSWYLYATAGLPLDFSTGAPLVDSPWDRQRTFWGLGIGKDWAISCVADFSVDIGFRQMVNPLPEIDCCPQVPASERFPYRTSNALFLRAGLTF